MLDISSSCSRITAGPLLPSWTSDPEEPTCSMASLQGAKPLFRGSLAEADFGPPTPATRLGFVRFGASRLHAEGGSLGLSVGHGERSSVLAPVCAVEETRTAYINGKADSVQGNFYNLHVPFSCFIVRTCESPVLRIMSRSCNLCIEPFPLLRLRWRVEGEFGKMVPSVYTTITITVWWDSYPFWTIYRQSCRFMRW